MAEHTVSFDIASEPVGVQTGTLLTEAARSAGVEIIQPCGGQGRCGRCMIRIADGTIRRRSTLRLSTQDVEQGFALACQTVVEGDVAVVVPPQEKIERRLSTDLTAAPITVPAGYDYFRDQTVRRVNLTVPPPSMDDQLRKQGLTTWVSSFSLQAHARLRRIKPGGLSPNFAEIPSCPYGQLSHFGRQSEVGD